MGFWSLNPYIGCEFGCTYCYARDTHRWAVERVSPKADESTGSDMRASEPPGAAVGETSFERNILVKANLAHALARTLDPARLAGHVLVIGTATDPYQPAERIYRLTRKVLEVLTLSLIHI